MNQLETDVAARIRRRGPIPFREVMELALYDQVHGFYSSGGVAGRRGDFLTSPEVGPLFGAVIARAIDTWWRDAGQPDPFVVIEAGAGPGTLASAVLHATPECAPALRYVLVERSAVQRAEHQRRLQLESPAFAFAPNRTEDEDDAGPADVAVGPIVVSLAELPRVHGAAVVLANELLDNLPVDLLEHRGGAWHDVRVGLSDDGERLVEHLLPTTMAPDIDAVDGARVPVQSAATEWVRRAQGLASRVVAFDYASTTSDLASRPAPEWLRTYRGHQRGAAPLDDLGTQDITVEVCVDQLPSPTSDLRQSDFLRAHGIDALVADGRRVWEERKAVGDLEAMAARSRITEAEALTDPAGLGAFRVLEWR
jgi:SAM-dependent MidA family methyltransferase